MNILANIGHHIGLEILLGCAIFYIIYIIFCAFTKCNKFWKTFSENNPKTYILLGAAFYVTMGYSHMVQGQHIFGPLFLLVMLIWISDALIDFQKNIEEKSKRVVIFPIEPRKGEICYKPDPYTAQIEPVIGKCQVNIEPKYASSYIREIKHKED